MPLTATHGCLLTIILTSALGGACESAGPRALEGDVAADTGETTGADVTPQADVITSDATGGAATADTRADTATDGGDLDATSDATTGPGVPVAAVVNCQLDLDAATGFYYGAQRKCIAYDGALSAQNEALLEAECTASLKGELVTSCPTADVVAYCVAQRYTSDGWLPVTHIIYQSAINPDAGWVSRNLLSVCPAGSTAYGSQDQPLEAACAGTFTASVDGVAQSFDDQLICLARTDGVRTTYLVRGIHAPGTADARELTLRVIKDATSEATLFTELLQPPYGYLEGATASGAFAFPAAGATPTIVASRFDLDGTGFAANFDLGALSTTPSPGGTERAITGGQIDIRLP